MKQSTLSQWQKIPWSHLDASPGHMSPKDASKDASPGHPSPPAAITGTLPQFHTKFDHRPPPYFTRT